MPKHVLLNNVQHKNTKVISQYDSQYADNVVSVLAFPTEFVELQKEYPILLRKDEETNGYLCIALLGLEKDENLFLDAKQDRGWRADYIPAMLEKGPFLIGFQNQEGSSDPAPVVHIDIEHPKVNEDEGQAIFLTHGGNSPYLNHVSTCLQVIHQGMQIQNAMFDHFTQLDLIEAVNIEYELVNGEKCRLSGNFTINEDKLRALTAEQLLTLNKLGFLQYAYAIVASATNIRKLIKFKNQKISHP